MVKAFFSMTEGAHVDVLNQRKEKVLEHLKNNKTWIQYILLGVIVWLGARIRSFVLPNLKNVITGEAISLELDSTLFLRYAEVIVEQGSLYSLDPLRYAPFGADISNLAVFTSYFIAYLYKFLHIFNSSITVAQANNLYPIVATMIMSFFMFLLVRRLFDWKVAILSVLFINVLPSFLFRSLGGSSDHDILAMMLIMMAFYLYVRAWQSEKLRSTLIFAGLAGFINALTAETAGSYTFVLMTIGIFNLIEIFLNKFERRDFYTLGTYILSFTVFYKLFNLHISVSPLFTSITTGAAYLAFAISVVYFVLFKTSLLPVGRFLDKYKEKVPEGILSLIIGVALGMIVALVSFGPSFFVSKARDLYGVVFKSFSYSRWALTVAENKTPFVIDWMSQFGKLYVWLFIVGSVLLFYDAVKELKRAKELTGVYTFFILGYIFSRYSPNSILNGASLLSRLWFYAAILVFIGVMGYSYFHAYRKKDPEFEKIRNINKRYAFVFTWFFLMILAAASAIRLLFEFSPITTILVSFLVVSAFDYLYSLKNQYLKFAGILLIIILLFSPFSAAKGLIVSNYESSVAQSRSSGPGYYIQWQQAGDWAQKNTPENAVFAHWWDYGYWVQAGFDRATITDGGNFFGWWNYLMGRHVLTGQTEEEPLKFLKAHDATHILMVADEIGKYPAYSSIGSDQNYDRYSWINTFSLDKENSVERRTETELMYQGGTVLDEDLVIDGKVYPANQAGVAAVILRIRNTEGGVELSQPSAAVVYQSQRVDLPVRCVFFNGKIIEFPDYKFDACFRLVPVFFSPTQVDPFGAALWLSPRVYHSRVGQMYLLDDESPYYKVVYDDADRTPLAIYQGRLVGPTKIWEIDYPKDVELTEEEKEYYLRTDYPDASLMAPR